MQKKINKTGEEINFANYLKHSTTFVETGTCSGRTVAKALELGYKFVVSVEAYEPFYKQCLERFGQEITVGSVVLYHGKSTEALPEMLKRVTGPAVFWLDAHPSGPATAGHDDLMANGDSSEFHQDRIIMEELELILAHRGDHVIIIDDQAGVTNSVLKFADRIEQQYPNYTYSLYDERMGPNYYHDKILVCEPLEVKRAHKNLMQRFA